MSRLGERILTGLFFLCLVVLSLHEITSHDVWWQIGAGEWILDNGIPRTDPFSYAFPGREWIEPRWLWCVGLFLVFEKLGPNALILLKTLLLVVTFGLLHRAGRPAGRWAVLLGLTLALATGHDRFMVRPELASFLGLALTLLCLQRFRQGGSARWLYPLPLLQVAWSNVHTLWILGPAVQWIVLAGELLESRFGSRLGIAPGDREPSAPKRLTAMLATAVLSTAATLANPYLLTGVLFPFRLFGEISGEHVLGRVIAEFNSPLSPIFLGWNYRTLAYVCVAAISATAFLLNRRAFSPSRALLWLAFLVLSLEAQRNVALFGIVAGFVTTLNLGELPNRSGEGRFGRACPRIAAAITATFSIVMVPLVASDAFYRSQGWPERFGLGVSDRRFPVRAMEFVREAELPTPVLGALGDSGYVLFSEGAQSVYVDGRLEVYDGRIITDALRLTMIGDGLDEEAGRTGVRTVLVRNNFGHRGLMQALETRPDWVPVYFDHLHVVYLKVDVGTGDLAMRYGFDWRHPEERRVERPSEVAPRGWPGKWWPRVGDAFEAERLGSLLAGVGNHEKALGQFERAVELDPSDARSCLFLGLYRRAAGREEEADALLARGPREAFDASEVNLTAGDIHLWAGRPAEALVYIRRAVELDGLHPGNARRLARAAMLAGEYDEAEETLRWMVERDPSSLEAWNSLGMVMLRQGRREEAERFFRTSLQIDPDQPRVREILESMPSSEAGSEGLP